MIKKIAGYCRISVDEEMDRDNTSIENQKSIISDYVSRVFKGAQVDFYCDRDRSGYTFEQREEYQKLRKKLMNGEYKILVIKDFSRFSRRNSKGLVELEDLRDAGIRIISIGDSIDYPTQDEWVAIQFRFLINEMPVTDTSKKVKNVIKRRQNEGKWICSVPYGYVMTDSKNMIFEVDEKSAEVVREIFNLYNSGWGYKKIANYLTDKKIPTPRMTEKARKDALGIENKIKAKAQWSIITIQEIISNDFYIGTLRQGKYKRAKINGRDIKNDKKEHFVFEKNHEAIIDEKVFTIAQSQLEKRTKSHYRGVKKYDTSYSGFLFCGDCSSPMFSMSRPDLAPAYVCGTYHTRGRKGCTSHHTRVDFLNSLIKSYIKIVRDNSEEMIKELEKSIRNESDYIGKSTLTVDALNEDLTKAKEQLKNLAKQKIRDISRRPEFADTIEETYSELEKEQLTLIEGIKYQIELAVNKRNNVISLNRKAKTVIEIFDDIINKDKFDKNDLSYIIEKITIYEDHIDIKLKAAIDAILKLNESKQIRTENVNFYNDTDLKIVVNDSKSDNTNDFHKDNKNISSCSLTLKTKNKRDKAISVNVISSGDPLEIFTDREGEIILKKYSPIGELGAFAKEYAESLAQTAGVITCIIDKDQIIAVSGGPKKDFYEKHISDAMEKCINSRSTITAKRNESNFVPLLEDEPVDSYNYQLVSPIICEGDVLGAVVFLSQDKKMGDVESKLAQTAAGFLGKQMES